MTKKSKAILLIIIALLLVFILFPAIILGSLYYFFMNPDLPAYESPTTPKISDKADETVITATATGEPSDTADWSTHTSDKFSFKYPAGYTVNEVIDPEDDLNKIVHVVAEDGLSPSFQITVYPDEATFALWEGQAWEDSAAVRDSFSMEKKLYSEFSNDEVMDIIVSPSQLAVVALRDKNLEQLTPLIHPDKGVRFSPYGYVDTTNDLTFTANQIDFTDTTQYTWGSYDGSGAPITATFDDYYDEFIFDKNFVHAEKIRNNEIIGTGNTINNWSEVYPNAIMVEYYYPGTEEYGEMDWASLRLVFEHKNHTDWYLVAIIHDQWTI